jgi:para-aminobenzoate synthetase / 4-amino-4-deoxychorismate lyase
MTNLREILDTPGTVLLDDTLAPAHALLFHSPSRIISCDIPSDVPECLRQIDSVIEAGQYVAGYLAYEAGYAFGGKHLLKEAEKNWSLEAGYPVLWFGVYDQSIRIPSSELNLVAADHSQERALPAVDARIEYSRYADVISTIRDLIHEGDLYQLNFTFRLDGIWPGDALELYGLIRRRQPVAYSAFINTGSVQILSASPEKFFSRTGQTITVRPMKGTAPRGNTPELDKMIEQWLVCDQKNRSENLMILDLLRNDLSRICVPGSVKSSPRFSIESYETVFQMVSGVTGLLEPGTGYAAIFSSLFPSGSITGAPKIRSMRRIAELEDDARGVYCGAIGFVGPNDQASFSVAIRTITINSDKYTTGSGGGIVWDSGAEDEFAEALLKTKYLSGRNLLESENDLELIETMYLCINNMLNTTFNKVINIPNLIDNHINRLISSAGAIGFIVDEASLRTRIDEAITEIDRPGEFKIRLLCRQDGCIRVDCSLLSGHNSDTPRRIGIASTRVHSENPFLYHKTTFRPDFDRGIREASERGLDDVVFVNQNGHITETTIFNIFLRHGAEWSTPARECGLLSGIGRSREISSPRAAVERELTLKELQEADEIVLTNAVRGRVQAILVS